MVAVSVFDISVNTFATVGGKKKKIGSVYSEYAKLVQATGTKSKRESNILKKAIEDKVGKTRKLRFIKSQKLRKKPALIRDDSLIDSIRRSIEAEKDEFFSSNINILNEGQGEGSETGSIGINRVSTATESSLGISFTSKDRKAAFRESLGKVTNKPIKDSVADKDLIGLIPKAATKLGISESDLIFKILKDNPKLGSIAFENANSVRFSFKPKNSTNIKVANVEFNKREFFSGKNITAKIRGKSIVFLTTPKFEQNLIKQLSSTALSEIKEDIFIFKKAASQIARGTLKRTKDVSLVGETRFRTSSGETGVLIFAGATKRKKSPKQKQPTITEFLSRRQLSILIQKDVDKRSPHGPKVGPPLSDKMLTMRTRRYLWSINVVNIILKQRKIAYEHNPIYYIHESTSRDPRKTIGQSVRTITLQHFGEAFGVVRV